MENLICSICNWKSKSLRSLSNHIARKHIKKNEIESLEKYYILYLMEGNGKPDGKCLHCGNQTRYISFRYGYRRHCGHECGNNDELVRKLKSENMKKALLEKYGVENPGQMSGHMDKVRKTRKERYGDENYVNPKKAVETNLKNHNGIFSSATDDYKEKYKKTCLEKYGVEHHTQSDIVKNNYKKTCLEKYGVENSSQNESIKQKTLNTSNERYGGTLHGSEIISKKIKKTNIEKYGVEFPTQNKEIQEKTKQTNLERYGSYYIVQNKNILQKLYGVDDINQLDWVVEKQKKNRQETLRTKYQVENVSQLQWVQDTIKKNNLERYGVESSNQLESVKNKSKATCLEKYGVEYSMQDRQVHDKCMSSNRRKAYKLRKYKLPNGNTVKYQSKMELAYIEDCVKNNIEIENGDKLPYYDNDGKKHYYFVDFKIKEDDKYRLVEIKGTTIWYYESIESGILLNKTLAAQAYSEEKGYLPFRMEINYGN